MPQYIFNNCNIRPSYRLFARYKMPFISIMLVLHTTAIVQMAKALSAIFPSLKGHPQLNTGLIHILGLSSALMLMQSCIIYIVMYVCAMIKWHGTIYAIEVLDLCHKITLISTRQAKWKLHIFSLVLQVM